MKSRPTRDAWIETVDDDVFTKIYSRVPHGTRGLKLYDTGNPAAGQ